MEKIGALESWQIIVSLPILLDPLVYLPIDTLIQEFIEFICVNIDFFDNDHIDPLCQHMRALYTGKICVFS